MLAEAKKQRARERLDELETVNRAFAGGDSYKHLARSLGKQAGLKENS